MAKNPITGLEESPASVTGAGTVQPAPTDQTTEKPISASITPKEMIIGGPKPVSSAPSVISPNEKVPTSASSAMTGAITQQGAYNPTTGGYETINKETGVNVGAYSPEEKQKMWAGAGLAGDYNPDAFYRDPVSGKLQMKAQTGATGLLTEQPAGAPKPTTPATPTTTTPTPGAPTVPTGTDKGAQVDSVIDTMFPKDKYTEEERAAIKQGLTSTDPKLWADMMANNAKGAYDKASEILNAFRTDRDLRLKMERENVLNDRRVQDLTQQYDNAIKTQKQRMETDQNNMAVVQGTAGRLKSRNMMNAISQLLDNNLSTYNQLVANKDRDIQRLAEDIKYAQTVISNEYNDKIGEEMQEMLKNIKSLDSTGALNTQNGLLQARSFVQKTLENNMQHQADYYYKLQYISSRFDQYHKEYQEQKTVDQNVTSQMSDGYLYNKYGSRVTDAQGNALHVGDTSGTFLGLQDDGLGGKVAIFRGIDGKVRTQQATTAPKLTDDQIAAAQNLISKGGDPTDVAKMLGLNGQQMAEALRGVSTIPSYDTKKIQVVYKEVTDENGNTTKIPGYFDPNTKQFHYEDGTTSQSAPISSDQKSAADTIKSFSEKQRGKTNLQCGQLANDYWKMITGSSAGLGDSLNDKISAINRAGPSDGPVQGGLFVSNPLGNKVGHTGIVLSTNPDGSITVLEANAQGKDEGGPAVVKTYQNTKGMIFSQAPQLSEKSPLATGQVTPSETPTVKTGTYADYGLRDESEYQNAVDLANGKIKITDLKSLYGKNQNAIKRITAAKDPILQDFNTKALEENGISIDKVPQSMRSAVLTMDSASLNSAIDMANYKAGVDLATARSTTGNNRLSIYAVAQAVAKAQGDKNFSADQYKRITENYAKYTDPTKTLGARRVALNTAINHIGEEMETYNQLGNTNYPWLNNMLNNIRSATGAGEPLAQKIISQALGSETAKVYAGSQSSQAEREEWAKDMQADMSPEQQKKFIQTTIKLLAGAARSIKAEGLKSVSVNGKPVRDLENVLDDNTRKLVQSVGLDPDQFETGAATTEAKETPVTGLNVPGITAKQSASILDKVRNTK